jgi:ATP-dependent Lhr-like helicase
MRDILVSTDEYPYLDFQAKDILESMRDDQQSYLSDEFAPIEHDDKGMIWWTWAGGNINNTIRIVLKIELDIEVQASNEYVKIKSDTLIIQKLREVIKKISDPGYWDNIEVLREIYSMVPNYHLSKFQPYLPEKLKLKLVADKVFDFEGTIEFLKHNET